MSQLTADRANEVLDYDRETGICTWKVSLSRRTKVGAVAGSLYKNGYLVVSIDGVRRGLHRVIFLMETGAWPPCEIDHCDLNRSNNRWNNLRPATKSQNRGNCPQHKDNKSGFKGVYLDKGRYWCATITVRAKKCYLGTFDTAEEAHAAYLAAAAKGFAEFHRAA
jgi:HNH endonuclease/AP2 domain